MRRTQGVSLGERNLVREHLILDANLLIMGFWNSERWVVVQGDEGVEEEYEDVGVGKLRFVDQRFEFDLFQLV